VEPLSNALEALRDRRFDEALRWFQVTASDFPDTGEALQARLHRIVILAAREASLLLLGNSWHAGMQRTVDGDYSFVNHKKEDFAKQMTRYYRARDDALEVFLIDVRRLLIEDGGSPVPIAFRGPMRVVRSEANIAGHLEHGFYLEAADCAALEEMLFDDAYAAYARALLGLDEDALLADAVSGNLDRKTFYGALMDRIATVVEEGLGSAHDRETVTRLAAVVLREGKNQPYDVAVTHAREILSRYGKAVEGPIRCGRCGETARPGWQFCPYDGAALPASETAPAGQSSKD